MITELTPLRPPTIEQDLVSRRRITFSFWAVVLFLGLPYWWYSTNIERLSLPTAEIDRWVARAPCYLKPTITVAPRSFPDDIIEDVAATLRGYLGALPALSCSNLVVTENTGVPANHSYELQVVSGFEYPTIYGHRTAHLSVNLKNKNAVRRRVKETASTLLAIRHPVSDPRVVKFSPKYKLVFSLLNQDATTGDALLDWDVENLLKDHISPMLTALAPLHTFEIETQIQYFAPLSIGVKHTEDGAIIDEADLRAFVNAADWNLASPLTSEPVLHFVLYVPSVENRPLLVRSSTGSIETSNAFISPQWGGVVIYSPPSPFTTPLPPRALSASFLQFSQHLHQLLGVPAPSPEGKTYGTPEEWQVDALLRKRLIEAVKETVETLKAIDDLARDLKNMRVGKEVQNGVKEALKDLDLADSVLASSPEQALQHASAALGLASKAYFNPTMLALLYFPDEHKYAVYTPLHGPVAVPLVVALVKEIKAWREKRRKKKEKDKTE